MVSFCSIGPRAVHLRRAVLNVVHRKHQFVEVALGAPAELSAVVGQYGLDLYAESFVEGQHTVVEQLAAVTGIFEV